MGMMTFKQVSRPRAMLYGMPHIGAWYQSDNVNSHKLVPGASCSVCGHRATQAHHCPPKSTARSILLMSEWGRFVLKPALIAVCAKCHTAIHRHEIIPTWEWDDEELVEQWASGYLLSHGYPAHSVKLNELGHWVFKRNED